MVNDVECEDETVDNRETPGVASGNHYSLFKKKALPSLAECWRWLKGLLYDFINLKKGHGKHDKALDKANELIKSLKL